MKKRVRLLLPVVLAIVLLLSACSGGEGGNSGSKASNDGGNNQESASPQETDKGKDPVKIRVAYYADETARETFNKIIENFMKEYDYIEVEDTGTDWTSHYTNLKVDLAAGQGPTVFLLDGPYIPQYASENAIVDLTDYLKEISMNDYYGFEEIRNPQGQYFAVPQGIQVNALYYNKDMFDAAQVEYPTSDWTTEDVYQAAQKLTNKEKKQYGIGLGNHFRYGWYTMIRQFGGDLLDKDRKISTFASDPKVKEAVEYMKKFWDEGLTPSFIEMEGELTLDPGSWFPRGYAAMFYDNFSRRLANDKEGINYDVALMPKGHNGGVNYSAFVANSWVLNDKASDKEKEAGWLFMKYFLGEEPQRLNGSLGEALTANKAIAKEILSSHTGNPEHVLAFLDNLEHAGDVGDSPVWEEWLGAVSTVFDEYFAGTITIDELLKKGDKAAQAVLDKQ